MRRFKVGDRVRCVKASHDTKVGQEHVVACPDCDGTMMVESDGWWHSQHDFELVTPPQPESPDDWVEITDPSHVLRYGIDQVYRTEEYQIDDKFGWEDVDGLGGRTWEQVKKYRFSEVRCRRKDLPPLPDEVHAGGPYVARSEYERVQCELANEKASSGQVIDGLRQTVSSQQAEIVRLNAECAGQVLEMASVMRQREVSNLNGWPLVPVDPACIPDGHRAVEVTRKTKGKLVAIQARAVRFPTDADHANLVVEPIPAEQPAQSPLPRPEFPAWIRAGWWVATDPGPVFWVYEYEPKVDEQCGEFISRGDCVLLSDGQLTPSMRAVPRDRWREAKWQVE